MFPDRVRECSIWHPLVSSMAHPGRPAQPWRNSNRSRLLGITVAAAIIGAAIDGYTGSTAPAVAVYAAGGLIAAYLLVRDGERLRSAGRLGGVVAVSAFVLSFPAILLVAYVTLIVLALFGQTI